MPLDIFRGQCRCGARYATTDLGQVRCPKCRPRRRDTQRRYDAHVQDHHAQHIATIRGAAMLLLAETARPAVGIPGYGRMSAIAEIAESLVGALCTLQDVPENDGADRDYLRTRCHHVGVQGEDVL